MCACIATPTPSTHLIMALKIFKNNSFLLKIFAANNSVLLINLHDPATNLKF